jgi:hypothetical protein
VYFRRNFEIAGKFRILIASEWSATEKRSVLGTR